MSYFDQLQGFGRPAPQAFYNSPMPGMQGVPSMATPGFNTPQEMYGPPSNLANPALGGWFDGWDSFKGNLRNTGALDSRDPVTGIANQGWAMPALSVLGGIGNGYMALQQYGLAKDALATSKAQFNQQYAAQRQLTNSSLEDRQAARVASNPGAYQSVGAYMNKYGVK